jgi:uncharacterized protein
VRALVNINVLIALLDSDHVSHQSAISWFSKHAWEGWASRPITQNGCIRIMSNPAYPNPPVQSVIERLAEACRQDIHAFWRDEVSLLDSDVVDSTRIHGPRQLTDIYPLALAVQHEGRLVTFDAGIPPAAVRKATTQNLLILWATFRNHLSEISIQGNIAQDAWFASLALEFGGEWITTVRDYGASTGWLGGRRFESVWCPASRLQLSGSEAHRV